jgi:Fic family protein
VSDKSESYASVIADLEQRRDALDRAIQELRSINGTVDGASSEQPRVRRPSGSLLEAAVDYLRGVAEPKRSYEIAAAIGVSNSNIGSTLHQLLKKGRVRKVGKGTWTLKKPEPQS